MKYSPPKKKRINDPLRYFFTLQILGRVFKGNPKEKWVSDGETRIASIIIMQNGIFKRRKSWTGTFYYKNYFSFLRSANDRFLREKSQIIWQGWDKETRRECFPLSSSSIKGNSPWIHSFQSWLSLSTHKNGDRYNDDRLRSPGKLLSNKRNRKKCDKANKIRFLRLDNPKVFD